MQEPADTLSIATDDALAEYEACQGSDFDQASESAAIRMYYQEIDWSASRNEVFQQLHSLLRTTHVNALPYSPGRHLFPAVDVRPHNALCSLYGAATCYEPRQKIIEALATERSRREWMTGHGISPADLSEEDKDVLDALYPYDCEHVVCRSWFRGDRAAEGDLHHLFCCESKCNQQYRGNRLLVRTVPSAVCAHDCGCYENDYFAPVAGHAAAARATLYFLLRYPTLITRNGNFGQRHVELMLEWHSSEPPGLYEKHRNMHVARKQGTRNPLIDWPNMADGVAFELGL